MAGATVDKDKQKAGQIGGARRAELLPPRRRTEIAQRTAMARWGLKASHRGNFKERLGIDVECYVLEDGDKTAIISQTGMARALGLSSHGKLTSLWEPQRASAYGTLFMPLPDIIRLLKKLSPLSNCTWLKRLGSTNLSFQTNYMSSCIDCMT
jgi:hypothetical protein